MTNDKQVEKLSLRAALEKIERWFGEFPATDQTWGDGTPMSYAALYGSNGERDYMREVARAALSASPADAEAMREALAAADAVEKVLLVSIQPYAREIALLAANLVGRVRALRPLPLAAQEARAAHKIMTREEYNGLNLVGWHETNFDFDGHGSVGIRYISAPAAPDAVKGAIAKGVKSGVSHFQDLDADEKNWEKLVADITHCVEREVAALSGGADKEGR